MEKNITLGFVSSALALQTGDFVTRDSVGTFYLFGKHRLFLTLAWRAYSNPNHLEITNRLSNRICGTGGRRATVRRVWELAEAMTGEPVYGPHDLRQF